MLGLRESERRERKAKKAERKMIYARVSYYFSCYELVKGEGKEKLSFSLFFSYLQLSQT